MVLFAGKVKNYIGFTLLNNNLKAISQLQLFGSENLVIKIITLNVIDSHVIDRYGNFRNCSRKMNNVVL